MAKKKISVLPDTDSAGQPIEPEVQFVGPKQVKLIEETPLEHILRVHFVNDTFEDFNRHILNALLEPAPYDLTTLRERAIKPVAEQILEVLKYNNVKVEDIQYLNDTIIGSINHSLDLADGKLWKRQGEERRDIHAKTVLDIDRVLTA